MARPNTRYCDMRTQNCRGKLFILNFLSIFQIFMSDRYIPLETLKRLPRSFFPVRLDTNLVLRLPCR